MVCGQSLAWMEHSVLVLKWILMSDPVSQVDSGLSSAPHGPHRRPATALGPHHYRHSLDLFAS